MMKIIEKIFKRKRIIEEALLEYGFTYDGKNYHFQAEIMEGDFKVYVSISHEKEIQAKLIDKMNDEEYLQAYSDNFDNAYVNTVREALAQLLEDIAEKCTEDLLFASEQANRIAKIIYQKYKIRPDFPWKDKANAKSAIFRHPHNNKWFALLMNIENGKISGSDDKTMVDAINLKIVPNQGEKLREKEGIFEAYHMNKKHWITAILDDVICDEEVLNLIETSYSLTK